MKHHYFKQFAKSLLITASVVLMAIFPYLQSLNAQATSSGGKLLPLNATQTTKSCATNVFTQVSNAKTNKFKSLLLNSDQYKAFIDQFYRTYSNDFTAHPEKVYAVSMNCRIGVYVPISGGAGFSFYGVWFDEETEQQVETGTGLFNYDSEGNIIARLTVGDQKIDAEITPEGRLVHGLARLDGQMRILDSDSVTVTNFFTCMGDCLESTGIPDWVLTAITIACGVICAVSAGVACLGCAILAAGIFGTEVTLCWLQCGNPARVYLPLILASN